MSPPSTVFNSDVIIFALQKLMARTPTDDSEAEKWDLSLAMVLTQPSIRVSSTAWLEVIWVLRPDERAVIAESFEPKISDDATTAEIARKAAELAAIYRGMPEYCRSCWGSDFDRQCGKCGRIACREDKRNDFIILASAIVNMENGVKELCTFDKQHLQFAGKPVVKGLAIMKPEPNTQRVLPAVDVAPEQIVQPVRSIPKSNKKR